MELEIQHLVSTSSAPTRLFPKSVSLWSIFAAQPLCCNMKTQRRAKDREKKTFLPVSNRKNPEWACGLWLAPLTSERWFIDRSCCSNMLTSSAPLHLTLTYPRQLPAIMGETVVAVAVAGGLVHGREQSQGELTDPDGLSRLWRAGRSVFRSGFSISQWLIRHIDQVIAWLWHYYSVNARASVLIRLDGPQREELNQGD